MSCQKRLRKTLALIAENNAASTLDIMRAAESLGDPRLRQRLLQRIHQLNQDALVLKQLAAGA